MPAWVHTRFQSLKKRGIVIGSVCKVITQDPDNLDEELESLASARNISKP